MDVVLSNLTGAEWWIFHDDLIVFADTIEEHASRLEHVLQRFEKANLSCKQQNVFLHNHKYSVWVT